MSKRRLIRANTPVILPYEIDPEPIKGLVSFSGLPLVAEAYRALGLDAEVTRQLRLKQRARGLTEAPLVEAFMLLLVAGGECVEDFRRMREEEPLEELVGYRTPSPDVGLKFLYGFHDEAILAGRPTAPGKAWVPPESAPLGGLFEVNRALIHQRAFEALPAEVEERYFRADSACYDQTVLSYLRHQGMVSADMGESLLWSVVRNRRLGYKFRRQSPCGPYTLDFVCIERRLVIEVDGEQHENSASDATRDAWLGAHGFRVLRFWHTEVLGNLEGVCHVIAEALGGTPPSLRMGPRAAR